MPPAFPTVFRNSRPAIQVQTTRVAYQKSTSGQRFRTVFPPGALFSLLNPTPGLTEKGDSAFMQSHSCQLKSGLSAHMTGRSFSLHGPPAFTGFPLPGKKAKSPAVCPYSPRRRRVPTGGPLAIRNAVPSCKTSVFSHRTFPSEQKAKFPAVCPYSPHRRCVPTGGPLAIRNAVPSCKTSVFSHRTSPPEQKAKSPAVCPYSSHRRCAPTGGPRKTLCVRILTGDLRRDMTQPFFQYKWEYGTMDIVRKNLSHVSLFVKILRC